jgi:hypothetical protein
MFRPGTVVTGGNMNPFGCSLRKDFRWMCVWELNPEGWDTFGWKPLRRGGGIVLAESFHDWGRRAVPLIQLCPGICLTTAEKHGKPQSGWPAEAANPVSDQPQCFSPVCPRPCSHTPLWRGWRFLGHSLTSFPACDGRGRWDKTAGQRLPG